MASCLRESGSLFLLVAGIILFQATVRADDHEFRYKAPDAKTVELMGEWNGWKSVPMTKGDNGVLTAKVTLSSVKYAYKFLFNGTDWVFDPDNPAKKTVDAIENSAVEIK
jgi:1,4-alpha-glucan branching enzyme